MSTNSNLSDEAVVRRFLVTDPPLPKALATVLLEHHWRSQVKVSGPCLDLTTLTTLSSGVDEAMARTRVADDNPPLSVELIEELLAS